MFRCVCVRPAAKAAETMAGSRLLPCASPMQGLLQFAGVLLSRTPTYSIVPDDLVAFETVLARERGPAPQFLL